jgi:hypothetical protein
MECADQIFGPRMVDGSLAAQRRVDLRDHRGRNLHQRYAAHVSRGGEAGQIADHAAADREDGAAPIQFRADDRIIDPLQRGERFALLASRDLQGPRGKARRLERGGHALAIERRNVGVGDDQRTSSGHTGRARELPCMVEYPGADVHRMGVGAEFYAEGAHRWALPRRPKISSTRSADSATDRSEVSTMKSARA